MRLTSSAFLFSLVIWLFMFGWISAVTARSWSYHYHPEAVTPTPIATPVKVAPSASEQSSTVKLLKLAIVSDLGIFAQDQSLQRNGYSDHMKDVTNRLSLFDGMNSPEALGVFASLSSYYLGAPAEKTYQCLALQKGRVLDGRV
jgi:hypothetical protein